MKDVGNSEIQWIINFHENQPAVINKYPNEKSSPPIDIVVPFPNKRTKFWLKGDLETQKKALESLEAIVEACKEIKGECMETLVNQKHEDAVDSVNEVTDNLKSLFHLIIEFTKLIKKIREGEDEQQGDQ